MKSTNGWPISRTLELVCLIPPAAAGLYTVFSGIKNADNFATIAGMLAAIGAAALCGLIVSNAIREAKGSDAISDLEEDVKYLKRRVGELSEQISGQPSVQI
ncbi:hypothetical protein GAO09_04555 [Rhizobiales bacterium RZME27]|uniref:Uncharacterized protein n=1 Tax=Endobacterium cereale TaxID=2663029 RepID=A0A6A8A7W4_9HYPH|nr:hypothetical protein [Endobacterium cereale]MQY45336.1 hypothetical protein [Endobacterium cereale]